MIREKMNPPLFMGTKMKNHLLSVHLTKGICVPGSVILREAAADRAESKKKKAARKYIRKMFQINEVHLI